MIRPIAMYIGLRYTLAKRSNQFISFISLVSMLGIALGVAVLITVLSVMNGFDYEIRTHFFSLAPQVTVITGRDIEKTWLKLQKTINFNSKIVASAPFITGIGLLSNEKVISGATILGIVPSQEKKVSQLDEKLVDGKLSSLTLGSYNIIIGQKLADQLRLSIGDKVSVFTPQVITTPLGVFPKFRRFTVSGIFSTKSGFGFDMGIAYINMRDGTRLFSSQGTSGLHIKIKNLYQAQVITKQLQKLLPGEFRVTNWTEQFGSFFKAIAMEKTIMFIILLLIVGVAIFNLISTLVMIVNDKQADIAILRTLGASPSMIMSIFIIQGAIVGFVGTLIGVISGIILALNATAIVSSIQQFFHVQFLKSSIYFVDFLPSRLQWFDVFNISFIALGLSLIATIYPALIAFQTEPAEALKYE